jgi:citrate synthase
VFAEVKGSGKEISANVDFYSGFVYGMLGIPEELYTPIFAVSRIVGWCAHRIEEQVSIQRIIRPAYKSVVPQKPYIPLDKRK